MASLTESDVHAILADIIDPNDEVVWLASGLWTFAHRLKWPTKEIPARFLSTVLTFLGPHRTLLISSYTFVYAGTRIYDVVRTAPETGVVARGALVHPSFVRTKQPIHNYLVAGPRAAEVAALPCSTAWGDDGVLAWIEKNNARLCMLGVPWHEGCSFFHRAEAVAAVPYRYFKKFPGRLLSNGVEIGPCQETMLVRSLAVAPDFDWARIRQQLPQHGPIRTSRNPLVFAESASAAHVQAAGLHILSEDPYGLLTNSGLIRDWVSKSRSSEIMALAPGDQSPFNRV